MGLYPGGYRDSPGRLRGVFCISDFPRQAKWLSESERQFLLKKTESNESHTVPVTSKDMVTFLSRATNWLGALMYFCESALINPFLTNH